MKDVLVGQVYATLAGQLDADIIRMMLAEVHKEENHRDEEFVKACELILNQRRERYITALEKKVVYVTSDTPYAISPNKITTTREAMGGEVREALAYLIDGVWYGPVVFSVESDSDIRAEDRRRLRERALRKAAEILTKEEMEAIGA